MRSVSSAELAPLLIIDPLRFVLKLLICTACLAIGVLGALQTNIALATLGIVLLGLMYAHMIELQHQCLHDTAFRRGSGWNRAIGVLLGLPMLVSYSHYRAVHLHHHRRRVVGRVVLVEREEAGFPLLDVMEQGAAQRCVGLRLALLDP